MTLKPDQASAPARRHSFWGEGEGKSYPQGNPILEARLLLPFRRGGGVHGRGCGGPGGRAPERQAGVEGAGSECAGRLANAVFVRRVYASTEFKEMDGPHFRP